MTLFVSLNLKEYSEYSTIAGCLYIFMADQRFAGRLFWTILITMMLVLGLYWSIFLYNNWDDNPVTTTVTTTGWNPFQFSPTF